MSIIIGIGNLMNICFSFFICKIMKVILLLFKVILRINEFIYDKVQNLSYMVIDLEMLDYFFMFILYMEILEDKKVK